MQWIIWKVKSGDLNKGNKHKSPTKGAENCHLQAERRALEDILANSPDCLLLVYFGETFHTLR